MKDTFTSRAQAVPGDRNAPQSRDGGDSKAQAEASSRTRTSSRAGAQQGARQTKATSQETRAKRLAAIAACSLAIAVASLAYGAYASASAVRTVQGVSESLVSTLVVANSLRAGDEVSENSLIIAHVPETYRVQGALGTQEGDKVSVVGKRVLVDVPQGTQITPELIEGHAANGHAAAALSSDRCAVTVAVDLETGVGGLLRPLDRVKVVSFEASPGGGASLTTLCEDVRIIALDEASSTSGQAYASVTIDVTDGQAQAVRSAEETGTVSFILLSASSDAEER